MKTVITYGTFDLFHQGHYNILKRAKALGDYLIVGVTSESYDIERGKLNVKDSLPDRIHNVLETGFADKIIVEEYQGQKINDIIKYQADILVVGSDWKGKFDYLNEYCDVIYLERTKGVSSTQIRSERGHLYRIGIVTDDVSDGSLVSEARFVSGIHVECVYARDFKTAQACAAEYELDAAFDDYETFLEHIDIVYIRTGLKKRVIQSEKAISAGKHVICESPVSLECADVRRLYRLAEEKRVFFTENIALPYLRAFIQFIWLLNGGMIGGIDRIEIRERCADLNPQKEPESWGRLPSAVHMALKLLNLHDQPLVKYTDMKNKEYRRKFISLYTENHLASIEISDSPYWSNGVSVYGSKGRAFVPDDWWNMGFFEINADQYDSPRRYSFNFEGTGMRYLLQESLITMDSESFSSCRFTEQDSCAMVRILQQVLQDA